MFVLMTDEGQYVTPAGATSPDPDQAALFTKRETARGLAVAGKAGLTVRQLLPADKCPGGAPFGGGLVVAP